MTAVARQCSKTADVSGIGVLWSGYKGILEEFCTKSLACTKCWCLNWRLFLVLVSCYYVMLKFDFPFSTFIIRIILPKKTLFIETLQLVTSLLAVTIGWKCLTLGWCDKSMKMWTAQESVRNFPSNGWLQNHFIKAPLPSRAMCEYIKTFNLTLDYRSHRMSLVWINLLLIVFFELTFSSATTNLVPRALGSNFANWFKLVGFWKPL